ncbi:ABC transporter ATP-binding component [Pyrobaculum aerophilum str. IM2]|uniref:ABC transporter ATP-binding component n=1 Tax=Pyrobaculum aerophilum (strain ATCC 51768 / DSM 7523 / JCM 9630 / CIP 104966 / NBRC 100827 / IM2) TaxID=178306 RepID=Q8ZV43_PYRAE|nr:AMP-binding protein [Pyrobaculum aerophilum]AAL64213.1 ABC transporter ATP-binding component [Pyrobaculum aerophilum str. IM2]
MRRPWEFLKGDTFPKLLQERALLNPRGVAFREKTWGIWRPTTWHEYYERVSKFAYGLLALGFRRGDHLAVVGYNRPEILIAEQSAMALGGISVGVYPDTLPEERAYWLDYTDVKVVVAEDQEQVDKILVVKKDLPKLEYIIYWDERMMWQYKDIKEPGLLSWKEVEKLGEEVRKSDSKLLEELIAKTHPDDVCLILSTSGTTGRPKGVMLTYSSMMSMAKNLWEVDPIQENFEYVSYLPFGWIGEQMMSLAMHMLVGFKINFVEEPETFWRDFREIAPHFMFGPARVYEMIYSKIMEHLEDTWDFDKKIFEIALNIGYRKVEAELTGKRIPFWLTLLWHISRMLIYRSILDKTGLKRIKYAYVGGSFLGPDYLKFYRALGVNLKRIWGMTEVSGIATVHPDNEVRLDTVGKPIANTEIKIAEDGEILVRTPAVMAGYYKRPEATAEALKEIVSLVGPNGAGKSTTLKAISGIVKTERGEITKGRILYNGEDLTNRKPEDIARLGIIHVLEGRRVFEELTVKEHLILAQRQARKLGAKPDVDIVFQYFPRLKERTDIRAGYLSGGEQQMLVIGMALIMRPKVMLLDEPSLGLSPKVTEELFQILKSMNEHEKITILLAEQNVYMSLRISNYGYILENGRVVLDGPSEQLLNNPDIKEFYLGLKGERFSYKDVKYWKRKKRYL